MRQRKFSTSLSRIPLSFLLTTVSAIGLSSNYAFAIDECGAGAGGVVTCDSTGNKYVGGIAYDRPDVTTLHVESGTIINRPAGMLLDGVSLQGGAVPLAVDLADGVEITTNGRNADGVYVGGRGNITITSTADITLVFTQIVAPPATATGALFGYIEAGGVGNIDITQFANSTIRVTGPEATGLYGLNGGTGSVNLTSSGEIVATGDTAYGLNAWNTSTSVGNATVTLTNDGSVFTDGYNAVGLYALNAGRGDALAFVDGDIMTLQEGSDGVIADIDNQLMAGTATVVLTNTATIRTEGDYANGAWALNWGLGDATLTSEATIETGGDHSAGLRAQIRQGTAPDPADPLDKGEHYRPGGTLSAADLSLHLEGSGSVVTTGVSSYGLSADNQGTGTTKVKMDSGSSVTTTGTLANGVNGLSGINAMNGGTVSFEQAAGAIVTVSGAQAFGVNLLGDKSASADLNGTVTAMGQFGVGASAFATTGPADIVVGAGTIVAGGWQADVAGLGVDTKRPSAGILLGSGTSSHLTNLGTIGAASDRAIADSGRQKGIFGSLTVDNGGSVIGFMEFADRGPNAVNNAGQFAVRHFADTDGDGARDTKRVSVSDFGASASSFNNNSGAAVLLAPVSGEARTDGTGYYIPTTGAGGRQLEASYYRLDRSAVVQGQFTNLGTFHNAGIIDLRGTATGNMLVMTGNASAGGAFGSGIFISDGGHLLLNTVLNEGLAAGGQTGSFSDVLVVDSTRLGTGATTIALDRRDGPGAATPGNGILLVEVRNKGASAPGVFVLDGDYVANGEQAVIQGAYAYNLFHNGVAGDTADGNWYLRNLALAPSVPVYEDYPKVLQPLIDVPTLQQRVGNRYWKEPAPRTPQTVFCKDAAQNYRCTVTDEQAAYYVGPDGTAAIDDNGIWGRIEAAHARHQPSLSTSDARFDSNIWRMQAGLDGLLFEGEGGKLIAGVTGSYGHVSANVMAPGSRGRIGTDGYGVGGTLTWYGSNGFYADAQAQAMWLDSDLSSATMGRTLVQGNKGFGYALSLEAGRRIEIGADWTLTPQAQLVYSKIRFDSFTDPFGSTVSLSDGDSLRGRLGLAAEYQKRWKDTDGTVSRISSYAIANLYNEFLDGTRVNVSGTELVASDDKLWGGLGLGGSYNWDDDKYSVYGEVSADTGLAHFGDSFDVGGSLGLRVKW